MGRPDRDQFQRLERCFNAALDLADGPERQNYVAQITREDPQTGGELRTLLESRDKVLAAAADFADNPPRFGPWKVVRTLGRGGMGTVYLVERADGAFEMTAAAKVVRLTMFFAEVEERFLRERQFLAMLNHPGISRLIDGGVSETGLPFLVMEFVDGEPISRYAERHALSSQERVSLIRQMLQALAYVHSAQVLHRDLKPSNVLVDQRGQVKLVDFGIARLMSGEGNSRELSNQSLALTPDYASPEQWRGDQLTPASDIYSSGILLYQLLTGQLPLRQDHMATLEAIEPTLDRILAKATAADAALRYSSAEAMDADLEAYLAGKVPAAKELTLPLRNDTGVRRNRLKLTALVAMVLLAGIAASIWFRREAPAVNRPESIAVLPFVHEQEDQETQYLADEITDSVRDSLSQNRLMLVIAKPSSVSFQRKNAQAAGIGLRVAKVLEGSVERLQNRVRIQARLIRTSDGKQLWSSTFDRQKNDASSVGTDLTAAVTANLRAVAGAPPTPPQPNLEATEWMMRGRHDVQPGTPQALALAEADYRKAIQLDPQYAPAYSSLAAVIFNRYQAAFRDHTDLEIAEVERLADKALALDPLLPQAHVLRGVMAHQYRWDWVAAEKEYTLATAGAPEAQAECWLSALLTHRGRFAEAMPHVERALRLDPYGAGTLNSLASVFYWMGRRDRASEMARRYHELAPNAIQAEALYLQALVADGHTEEGWQGFKKLRERSPGPGAMFEAWARAQAGQKEETLQLLRPLEAKYPDTGVPLQGFALAYGRLGDEENTVKWLERAADRHEWQVLNLAVNPSFRKMEDSPGFHKLKKRLGLE